MTTTKTSLAGWLALMAFAITGASCGHDDTDTGAWLSTVSVLQNEMALNRAHDVELKGDLAFVPGKGGSLAIIDVADPQAPKILWHRRDPEAMGDAEAVMPLGDQLLLGAIDFISIDITDPTLPIVLKQIEVHRESHINGMVRHGDQVLAANKSGWIDAFDVSEPTSPQLIGSLNTRQDHDLLDPHDIDVFGDYAVVVDPRRFGQQPSGKVAVFRVADSVSRVTLDVSLWRLEGLVEDAQLMGANRVQVAGGFAFVAGSLSPSYRSQHDPDARARFCVIDLADPAEPKLVASVPFTDTRGPNGLTVAGRVVFLAGGQTIEAIDVSDPRNPVKLGSKTLPLSVPFDEPTDSLHDLVYRDGHLYVSGQSDHTFHILRVTDPHILELASRQW
ncbi:MAG: LVIVD repeat-containing protein [Planctomycetota bacterium]|jgi:hypothetical protein